MKNFLFIALAIVLAIVALSSIGPMIGMAVSLIIVYFSLKYFLASDSILLKIIWALIGFIGLSGLVSSLPALLGVVAVYFLYTGYKNYNLKPKDEPKKGPNNDPKKTSDNDTDPFKGFERQWRELENNK